MPDEYSFDMCAQREEPPVSGPDGICNIFFSGCNLRCFIARIMRSSVQQGIKRRSPDYGTALERIITFLTPNQAVGFVSPSHVVPQVKAINRGLNARGYRPVTVYNTTVMISRRY
jgi:putative pyruvate formate lyase activating enzyme